MDDNNEIIEVNNNEENLYSDNTVTDVKEDVIEVKPKKVKKEFFFKRLSKKGKIIFIVCLSLFVLAIIAVILYFCVFKKDKTTVKEENVVLESENYIYENGKLKLLSDDKIIGVYNCTDKDTKKCYVAKLSYEDEFDSPIYQDETGKIIEENSKIYNEKYVFIYDDEKIVLYDIEKETKTGEYELIKTGSVDNLVVYKDTDENYGIIKFSDNSYEEILNDYDYLGIYDSNKYFLAKENSSSYIIDETGKSISAKTSGTIKKFNEDFISIFESDSYSLYNLKGESILSNYDDIDYIDFYEDFIVIIRSGKLYAFDKDVNKLNENGIKLKNENYNRVYVFDEAGELKETKKAYSLSYASGQLAVELNESNIKEINIYEGLLNKNYNYVSYFDGILYIYSDENKENLLGKYTCTYKNSVNESSTGFNNCFIARESNILNTNKENAFIPIINGTYAFINDTKSGATKNLIYLYNIISGSNSNLPKYTKVDTGYGSENITNVTTLNSLIAAQSYSDQSYGVITFGQSGAESLIPFRVSDENATTTSISLFNDEYILAKRTNKNYLYDKKGTLVASSKFDIISYENGYLLVKDTGYILYKMNEGGESGSIVSSELEYIKMYDKYFVGINAGKLNVYKYTDGKTELLETSLDLVVSDTKYENFKFEVTGSNLIVSIMQNDKTYKEYKYDLTGKLVEDGKE